MTHWKVLGGCAYAVTATRRTSVPVMVTPGASQLVAGGTVPRLLFGLEQDDREALFICRLEPVAGHEARG